MVESDIIFSISNFFWKYFECATLSHGKKGELRTLLKKAGCGYLRDFPLNDIETIVNNNLRVVLVDATYIDEDDHVVPYFRWVELPSKRK